MSDFLKKVQTGQRLSIPAAAYNAFVDAANDYRRRSQQVERGKTQPGQQGGVLVRNDSGADRGRFAVLGIDSPIISPSSNEAEFKNRVTFSCVTPDAQVHKGRFVVLAEPLANGKIGRAYASGVCAARVNVTSADHKFAEAATGVTTLASAESGTARILWKESGTGEKWVVVLLGAGQAGQVGYQDIYPAVIIGEGNSGTWNVKLCTLEQGIVTPYGEVIENQYLFPPDYTPEVGEVVYLYARDQVYLVLAGTSGGEQIDWKLVFQTMLEGDNNQTITITWNEDDQKFVVASVLQVAISDVYITVDAQINGITGYKTFYLGLNIDALYSRLSFDPPPGWGSVITVAIAEGDPLLGVTYNEETETYTLHAPLVIQGDETTIHVEKTPGAPTYTISAIGSGGWDTTVVTAAGDEFLSVDEDIDEENHTKTYTLSHAAVSISGDNGAISVTKWQGVPSWTISLLPAHLPLTSEDGTVSLTFGSSAVDLSVPVTLTSNDGSVVITPLEGHPNEYDLAVAATQYAVVKAQNEGGGWDVKRCRFGQDQNGAPIITEEGDLLENVPAWPATGWPVVDEDPGPPDVVVLIGADVDEYVIIPAAGVALWG